MTPAPRWPLLETHAQHFTRRVVEDAVTEATAECWEHRAETFEQARPQPGDYTGCATPAQLKAADQRCALAALACRRMAWLVRDLGLDQEARDLIDHALGGET